MDPKPRPSPSTIIPESETLQALEQTTIWFRSREGRILQHPYQANLSDIYRMQMKHLGITEIEDEETRREYMLIHKRMSEADSLVRPRFDRPNTVVGQSESRRLWGEWGERNYEMDRMMEFWTSILQIATHQQDNNELVLTTILLSLGAEMWTLRQSNLQRDIARHEGIKHYDELALLKEFCLGRTLTVSLGGVSISDISRISPNDPDGVLSAYRLIVDATRLGEGVGVEELSGQAFDPFKEDFPVLTLEEIPDHLRDVSGALAFTSAERFEEMLQRVPIKETTEFVRSKREIRTFLEKKDRLCEYVWRTLMHPDDSAFETYKEMMTRYLALDYKTAEVALVAGRFTGSVDRLMSSYRQAMRFVHAGIHPEFYSPLARALVRYAHDYYVEGEIATLSDLDAVIDNQGRVTGTVDVWDELRVMTDSIHHTHGEKKYDIDPSRVTDWGFFRQPQVIHVDFDPQRPRRFTLALEYFSESGDNLAIPIYFDTAHETWDWSILEGVDDDSSDTVRKLYDSSWQIVQSALDDILRQARERHEIPTDDAKTIRPMREKGSHVIDEEVLEARRELKGQRLKGRAASLKGVLGQRVDAREKFGGTSGEIEVLIDADRTIEDLLSDGNIDHQLWKKVIDDIMALDGSRIDLTDLSSRPFKRLKSRSRSGEWFWSHRIPAKGHGDIRVLARRLSPTQYHIVQIGYRGSIFQVLKLPKL